MKLKKKIIRNRGLTVAAIVFAVAEEPLGDAAVVAPLGAAAPAGRAVALAADVRRLVAAVATVVVGVTVPVTGDAQIRRERITVSSSSGA